MQFAGKSGIAFFVLIVSVACGAGFGSGLLIGRQYPAHHFVRFGNSSYLLDPTTGKVCNPFKSPKETANIIDRASGASNPAPAYDANGFQIVKNPADASPDPFAAYGGHEIKPAQPDYPPACGK
jgi:hypothetical protein